ncbi:MAG TPA: hypothetical protein VMN57_16895 [Anaerolineales bacterium]|nr:hypothetical protein [Anaerolineales bacterium]
MVNRKIIPIYTTRGDLGALMKYPYLFDKSGDWIGFVTEEREVYSLQGSYVGYLADGPRILRKRVYSFDKPRVEPPENPGRIHAPATIPLAPMMSELTYSVIDLLEEEPDRLATSDAGELREDLD